MFASRWLHSPDNSKGLEVATAKRCTCTTLRTRGWRCQAGATTEPSSGCCSRPRSCQAQTHTDDRHTHTNSVTPLGGHQRAHALPVSFGAIRFGNTHINDDIAVHVVGMPPLKPLPDSRSSLHMHTKGTSLAGPSPRRRTPSRPHARQPAMPLRPTLT